MDEEGESVWDRHGKGTNGGEVGQQPGQGDQKHGSRQDSTSEMLLNLYETTQYNIPEDGHLQQADEV
jgi:hypothetical protein